MSIPYQSILDEDERSNCGAFFRMLPVDDQSYVGALLLVDSRGEPLEFTYNKAAVRHKLLWRERDLRRAVTRELLTSLLDNCPRVPSALFFLARKVESEIFTEDLDIERPVARVATDDELIGLTAIEEAEPLGGKDGVQVFWVRGRPTESTSAHRLAERLAARGLLLEPFDRVLAGLREAYEISEPETVDEPD
jgi:hypothetical protein